MLMSPQAVSLILIGCFAVGLGVAAYRGHSMPTSVMLALVIVGPIVVLAPTAFSVFLQFTGQRPQITDDERITCWILGGVMTMVGIVASIIPRRLSCLIGILLLNLTRSSTSTAAEQYLVFKSADHGRSWSQACQGLPHSSPDIAFLVRLGPVW